MRQIEMAARAISQVMFKKDTVESSIIDEQTGQFSEDKFLSYYLKRLILDQKIDKADKLLRSYIQADPSIVNLQTALAFYDELKNMPLSKLEAGHFSLEDVLAGLQWIETIYPE